MRSQQRKAVLMVLYLLNCNLPSAYCVASFAAGAELSFMNVRVAVCTLASHIAEYKLGMARRTTDSYVHAAQWKFRLIVIEFRNAADGLPSTESVAVLTGNVERAVRAMRRDRRLRRGA